MLQLCKDLDPSDQEIICPVLDNNNYFAHPENILLTAVGDMNEENRRYGIENIIAARRKLNPRDCNIRTFDKKNIALNFSAASYMDIIDWTKCDVTPPPLLSHISNEELSCNRPIVLDQIPCHSQAVERTVKDISAASSKVYGHKSRHGMILVAKKCRLEMKTVHNKAHFK